MNEAPAGGVMDAIDINRIMAMIPHRYPMLLIDLVVDIVPGESAVGIKNVTINEPQFQGHFPQRPVMPGVLIVEAMAQTAAVLVVQTLGAEVEGKLLYFMSIDNCRFRRPVGPGDVMHLHVSKERAKGKVWKFRGTVYVDEILCSEASFMAMLADE
ncbi:MAG: 3-hydroxyacyl-ACP dehydratase FabZ [Alphaproteobacteria bacterium]|jgi:3-hydroxyacyl-[acyl-carrier-protein] dehydratase|nr:3-hydroxyacyl-[acyl-carrier-protein] dehydratase FabZ [Rhodospirillaceae bacterium]MDP6023417.1 3-hydroxyacyl-ACP dehydratase FabZ [Alphaproteobacteria bacterium]MDP6253661.1 3-hydroxyacyl-ACP dehydratase FabZ [Alphaproteobacteria bacterium]MDP7055608.1 3-hydroxyacyl-ACP dehydratase FabZ [Alphaproteobacteria bacterium]MDP7229242.1 3-hydroxyacyl-ACP dehydratase FabZ [Alphaproteobacteria bacterium]|tara:strand:+ start:6368 stop:6835 length:468 start_codon:yes stop_codon:yes gene_type:complete